jgi:hypothetical protein
VAPTSSVSVTFSGWTAVPRLWMAGIPALKRRRLDIELGPVGDHDLPYALALPGAVALLLAWIRLLARVQCGKLPP